MNEAREGISHHLLTFGRTKIPFKLAYRSKRRLSITVMPNREVMVVAPKGQEFEKIFALVKKRASWIAKKRDYFEQFHPLPKEQRFVSGETHLYLGRQYRLKVTMHKERSVKLIGKFFYVSVENPKLRQTVKAALDKWYSERALKIFTSKINAYIKKHSSLQLLPHQLTIRRMSTRWGSCTKAGNISLNLDLIKAPIHCIEYVVAHELSHLKVLDHSPRFYSLLRQLIPDWEKRKARLDNFIF